MPHLIAAFPFLWRLGATRSPLPVLGVAAVIMLACQLAIPIWDVDIFWQLKLGQLTRQDGLPTKEPLLAHATDRLSSIYWIGQVIYSIVFDVAGWCGVRVFDAVIWFGGFYAVARQAARRLGNDWPAVAALAVGFVAALPFASLRMQSFGVLAFGLMITLVASRRPMTVIVPIAALLFVAWQNLHPSVVMAGVYLGARAIGVAWAAKRLNSEFKMLALLAALAAAATLATPDGPGIFALSRYNAEISKEQRGITEWQPMWACGIWNNGRDVAWGAMAAALVIVAITAAVRRSAIATKDLLPMLALTAMTLYCHRFVLFWGVSVIPVLAACMASWVKVNPVTIRDWPPVRLTILLLAAALGIGMPLARQPVLFAHYFPFDAVNALEAAHFEGVIFNDYFWGGVLSLHGHPRWRPTHDGRYYRLPWAEWDWYDLAVTGNVPLDAITARFPAEAFFLRKWANDGLITRLRTDARWRLVFEDELSAVFVRPSS